MLILSHRNNNTSMPSHVLVNDEVVERVTHYKYLGVVIDDPLQRNKHIERITFRAYQHLGLLRWCKDKLPLMARVRFYQCLVQPLLEYASVV